MVWLEESGVDLGVDLSALEPVRGVDLGTDRGAGAAGVVTMSASSAKDTERRSWLLSRGESFRMADLFICSTPGL